MCAIRRQPVEPFTIFNDTCTRKPGSAPALNPARRADAEQPQPFAQHVGHAGAEADAAVARRRR